MQTNLPSTRTAQLKAKYHRLLARLQKAMRMGRFAQFAAHKQQQLLRLLNRYEEQLRRLGYAAVCSLPLLAAPDLADAQPVLQGGEFQVNTYTTNYQRSPKVAMDDDGDFVVIWTSGDFSTTQDGSWEGIFGQRYNSSGTAQGSEFQVNTYTTNRQSLPDVAMDSDGDFVVVWFSISQDDGTAGIFGQRYNNMGTAQGSEFQVNSYTTDSQFGPRIAMDDDGDFVVVWISKYQDGDGDGVFGQRYNSMGTAQGSEFQINTYTTGKQSLPTVAIDSDGDFVVTWISDGQDGDDYGVFGQRYNSNGNAQGSEFQINTYTTGKQHAPDLAMDNAGGFVVAWTDGDYPVDGQDGSYDGIYARRYNNNGNAQGPEFQVNTYTTDTQGSPDVAMDSDGDFVVAWDSFTQEGSGFNYGIYGQLYNSSGVAHCGGEFHINTYTTLNQKDAAVAMDSDGDFVATWFSFQGLDDMEVYAQRFAQPVACGPTASLPTTVGTYTAACSDLNADGFTYYCDGNGNLLLAIKPPAMDWDIPPEAVQLKIGTPTVDFFSKFCGATGDDRCFIRNNNGAPVINRYWEIDENKMTVGTVNGFVEIKHFFTNAEFLALNAELTAQSVPALSAVTDMEFYNVNGHTVTTPFPAVPDVKPFHAAIVLKNDATDPRPSQWVHSTHGVSDHTATFRIYPTMLNSGGGMGGKIKN